MARVALAGVVLCACDDGGERWARRSLAVAETGPWVVPAETLARGDEQYVAYVGAGAWVGEEGCAGGVSGSAAALRTEVLARFPQIAFVGDYVCRAIVGDDSRTSVHGVGRALDLHIPTTAAAEADNSLGDPVANWLVESAEAHAIQLVIWDRWQWNASRPPGDKSIAYGGTHPHHDHIHVEVTLPTATPSLAVLGETPSPCPPIPREGGGVDEQDPCVLRFGPQRFWTIAADGGVAGSYLTTGAFISTDPSNWARFEVRFAEAGHYEVEVNLPETSEGAPAVRYEIWDTGGRRLRWLDQSSARGWRSLGAFEFAADREHAVAVFDHVDAAFPPAAVIVVDAVRFTPVGP